MNSSPQSSSSSSSSSDHHPQSNENSSAELSGNNPPPSALFSGVIVWYTDMGHTIIQAPNASIIPQNVVLLQKYFPLMLHYIAENVISVTKRTQFYLINIETGGIPAFIPHDRILELVRKYEHEHMQNIDHELQQEIHPPPPQPHTTTEHSPNGHHTPTDSPTDPINQITQHMQHHQFFDPKRSSPQQQFQQQQQFYQPNAPQHVFPQHPFYSPPQYFAPPMQGSFPPFGGPHPSYGALPHDALPQSGIPNMSPSPAMGTYSPSSMHPQAPHGHPSASRRTDYYRQDRRRSPGQKPHMSHQNKKYQFRFNKYYKKSKSDRPKSGIEIEDEYHMSGALFYTIRSGKVSLLLQKRVQWDKEQKSTKNIWLHFYAPRDNNVDVDSVSTIARAFTNDTCGAIAKRDMDKATKDLEILLRNPKHNESIYVEESEYHVHLCSLDSSLLHEKEINAILKGQHESDPNRSSSDRCMEVAWFDLELILKKVKMSRPDQQVSGIRNGEGYLSQVTKGILAHQMIHDRLKEIAHMSHSDSKRGFKKVWRGRGGSTYRGTKRGGYSPSAGRHSPSSTANNSNNNNGTGKHKPQDKKADFQGEESFPQLQGASATKEKPPKTDQKQKSSEEATVLKRP